MSGRETRPQPRIDLAARRSSVRLFCARCGLLRWLGAAMARGARRAFRIPFRPRPCLDAGEGPGTDGSGASPAGAAPALWESEAVLGLLQKRAGAGVWEWDPATERIRWSLEHFALYGADPDAELTFQAWLARLHPDDRGPVERTLRRAAASGGDLDVRFRMAHPRNGERWISLVGRSYAGSDGGGRCVAGIALDVTDRVAAKALRGIEAELGKARRELAAMDKALAVVGHELRTPLASLRLLSEFLLFDEGADLAVWRRTVEQINGVSISMAEVVDGLLDAARLNSGCASWAWGRVDVRAVCEDVLGVLRPLVYGKPVELELVVGHGSDPVLGDAGAVRRLLVNLMSNACKNTREGSVRLSVRTQAEGGRRWVVFDVADTGCGMPRHVLRRLGVPFALSGGSDQDRRVCGSGLGISICKAIAAAHGGTLRVSSAPGAGTRVRARLRADLSAPAPVENTAGVLLVEPAPAAGAVL